MRGTLVMYVLIWTALLGTGALGQCSDSSRPSYMSPGVNRTYNIYSPNYPRNYSNFENCQWQITAPTGYNVRLLIVDFDLEYKEDCWFDSLEVFDGPMEPKNLIMKLCGNNSRNIMLRSSGNVMYIKFRSNNVNTRRGFQLMCDIIDKSPNTATTRTTTAVDNKILDRNYDACRWQRGPLAISVFNSYFQRLTSPWNPYYYTKSNECEWQLNTVYNRVIVIDIISVTAGGSDCNVLQIYDGGTINSPLLYNSCNGGTGAITSTGEEVFVKFTSDGALTTGFKIDYKTVEKQSKDVLGPPLESPSNFVLYAIIGGVVGFMVITCVIIFTITKLLKQRSTHAPTSSRPRSESSLTNNNHTYNLSLHCPRRPPTSDAPPAYSNFLMSEDQPSTSSSVTSQSVASAPLDSAENPVHSDPSITDLTHAAGSLPPSYTAALLAAISYDVVPPCETGDLPPPYSESILPFLDGANKDA